MKKSAFSFSILFVFALMTVSVTAVYSQTVEPSYEVSLQLLVGSNDGGSIPEVPQNLSAISRQLKASFPFSKYRLAHTLIGRVSEVGSLQYRSVGDVFNQTLDGRSSFLEWSIINLKNTSATKGQAVFQAQSFRFGGRIPVVVGNTKDETGKLSPNILYEEILLTLSKVGLSENVPTLMGTLNLPGAGGTIFIVMTAKSAAL